MAPTPPKKPAPAKKPARPTTLEPWYEPQIIDTDSVPYSMTFYLQIELSIAGTPAMTAVYAPDRSKIRYPYDIIWYFHGNKKTSGMTIQKYLQDPETALREFILKSQRRNFLLVAPTLGDVDQAGKLADPANARPYLQQVVNAMHTGLYGDPAKYDSGDPPSLDNAIGKVVMAAHSGGGHPMRTIVTSKVLDDKIREIWCLDCTYGGGAAWRDWAKAPGHTLDRLFVYSSGFVWNKAGTGDGGTDADANVLYDAATDKTKPQKNIEVYIADSKKTTPGWRYGFASGHYPPIAMYFPQLIDTSNVLK